MKMSLEQTSKIVMLVRVMVSWKCNSCNIILITGIEYIFVDIQIFQSLNIGIGYILISNVKPVNITCRFR